MAPVASVTGVFSFPIALIFYISVMQSEILSPEAIAALRGDTPGCEQVIHFNNAGAALMPAQVADSVLKYLEHEIKYGGYETADKFSSQIAKVYSSVANYLNCEPTEVAIMENATAAWGQAFLSVPFQTGDIILTSVTEYASNYIGFLQMKKRKKVEIKVVPNDRFGQIDIGALSQMMNKKVKLIAISHVPTNGGLVNPAEAVGKIAKQHGVFYLLDACQSVGQMPLEVNQIGCDFLSATSRKYLRGPRGVGFLYVSKERFDQLEPPLMDLHAATLESSTEYRAREDAKKFENWESNLAGVVGMGAAIDYMLNIGIDPIWDRIQNLAEYLRQQLSMIPQIEVQDQGELKCGIVSFTTLEDTLQLKQNLSDSGFNVSIISPAHTLLDMNSRGLGHMIRASIHYYNSRDEVDQFVGCLANLLHKK